MGSLWAHSSSAQEEAAEPRAGKLQEARDAALSFASELWGGAQADEGVIYFGLQGYTSAVVFTLRAGDDRLPGAQEILSAVRSHRRAREEARRLMEVAEASQDIGLLSTATAAYLDACRLMLDEEGYGTIVVTNLAEAPRVAMAYRGLPPHYVSRDDAYEVAGERLGVGKTTLRRFIFLGILDFLAEFQSSGGPVLRDMLFLRDTPHPACGGAASEAGGESSFGRQPSPEPSARNDGALRKAAAVRYISGVPDYQTIYSRGCAPAASGCVLGYWDDHGYNLLVEGGTSATAGHRDPGGYGYLHTIWDELGPAMGYVVGQGTPMANIPGGIEAVCNSPQYQNYYAFSATIFSYPTPPYDRQMYHSLIEAGLPFVYAMRHPLYGGGAGYHSVTGVGWMSNGSGYFRIVHDNNTATGTDVYLNESDIYQTWTYITRVVPGAAKPMLSESAPSSYRLALCPNPFSTETRIWYRGQADGEVVVEIFDSTGRSVRAFSSACRAGEFHSFVWDGKDRHGGRLPGGVYLYRVAAGRQQLAGKVVLFR